MSEAKAGALQFQTTPDERTFGMICGLLAAFTGFVGPLIIFIIKRDSLFVKLCALQALFWHVMYGIGVMILMMVFFVGMITTGVLSAGHKGGPPPAFIFLFPFVWLFMMLGWIINFVLGIMSALKANEGIWWPYPITGRLAAKFLGVNV